MVFSTLASAASFPYRREAISPSIDAPLRSASSRAFFSRALSAALSASNFSNSATLADQAQARQLAHTTFSYKLCWHQRPASGCWMPPEVDARGATAPRCATCEPPPPGGSISGPDTSS